MKRSEMQFRIARKLQKDRKSDFLMAIDMLNAAKILDLIEEAGMQPPEINGVYDPVPTVTPTGNHQYSWKRGWEAE